MKTVIFDMDGTLIDTRVDITISVNYVRHQRHGLPPLSEEEVVDYINRDERNLPLLFYGTETLDPADRELFRRHYLQQCTRHLRLFPGIVTLLEDLAARKVAMGVATNASSLFARKMLGHLGIDHYFTVIAGADTAGRPKPDPAMIHAVLEGIGPEARTGAAWLLGDSDKDMAAARNAGIPALYAGWGYAPVRQADAILHHPQELLAIVDSAPASPSDFEKGETQWT
ncbi:HAD family hydrolase [Nitratifractor sp.]|uniref:HAD family hydrolase n=1 Tax=Nitratifractor sp. TaxID=2268144 RepID=UPI0025F94721|nr:HAD family hydrolase [Nitratifractor sp.]